ncbi:hypothetical protein [Frondihabitans cladoniiphilus]
MPRRVLAPEPTPGSLLGSEPPAPFPPAPVAAPAAAEPVAPAAAPPITAPVATQPLAPRRLPEPPRRELTALSHHVIGAGTAVLTRAPQAGAVKRPLASIPESLPAPTDDDLPKPLRRQPAFIVSIVAAIVILVGVATFLVLQQVLRGPDTVQNLTVLDGGNNYVLQWNGPDVPYSVAATNAPSNTIDVTRFVKGGRQAFVPKSGLGVSKSSCFVVRSQAEASSHAVPTTAAELASEGGRKFCVADIGD